MHGAARLVVVLSAGVALTGCISDDPAPLSDRASVPAAASRVPVRVGDVALRVEVADDDEERAAGLRGRNGVPPGTGMVFRYPSPRPVRFTMSGVAYPLVAVFARQGRVVSVSRMTPCDGSLAACPTYGPEEPVDTVVEAAPGSLPDVAPGDRLEDATD